MNYTTGLRVFLAGLLMSLFVAIPSVEAFGVMPARVRFSVSPGTSQVVAVTLSNDEARAVTYQLQVARVAQAEDGSVRFVRDAVEEAAWFTSGLTAVEVPARAEKKIPVTVTVPTGIEPGERRLALLITPALDGQPITTQAAVMLSLVVAGSVTETLSIDSMTVSPGVWTAPVGNVKIIFSNTGTVSVPMAGVTVLRNWRGKEVARVPFEAGAPLFPKVKREVSREVNFSSALQTPGYYTMSTRVTFGASSSVIESRTGFWFVPPWSAVFGVVVLAVIIVTLLRIKRNRH